MEVNEHARTRAQARDLLGRRQRPDDGPLRRSVADHPGPPRIFRKLAPQAVILGSAKTKEMLRGFSGIEDGVRVVVDGETLSLGGATLKFLSTPFVHWPETIMTYEESQKVLFSCDGFGGYGALRGAVFDYERNH